jgi:MFS family permease
LLALVSQAFLEFWGALVLLGLGWNFLFVGATVLLTRSYRPAERFKTQALNDFSIFSVQAVASLSAGTLLYAVGWQVMSLVVLVPLILLLAALVVLRGKLADPPTMPVAAQGD